MKKDDVYMGIGVVVTLLFAFFLNTIHKKSVESENKNNK